MDKLKLSPVTRVNGPLTVEVDIDSNKIVDAKIAVSGFRNFEKILGDRDPFDLSFISQRVCARCSIAHGVAAVSALENSYNISITRAGKLVRAILQGLELVSSHIGTFYQSILPDYIDMSALLKYNGSSKGLLELKNKMTSLNLNGDIFPFKMDNNGDRINNDEVVLNLLAHYLDVFKIQAKIHKLIALFGGKLPNPAAIVPGGVTLTPGIDQIRELIFQLKDIAHWVEGVFLADALKIVPSLLAYGKIGVGAGNFLALGGLAVDELGEEKFFPKGVILENDLTTVLNLEIDKITEETEFSWYSEDSGRRHPSDGRTFLDKKKKNAYSFVKAPRYKDKAMEVGPLARLLIKGDKTLLKLSNDLKIGPSVLARIISYAVETQIVIEQVFDWASLLRPGDTAIIHKKPVSFAEGFGLSESPSGSVGYWVNIEDKRLSSLQIIAGSSWNLSPKAKNVRGPIEEALIGLEINDIKNPIDIYRVIRSFGSCPACASH